jgi:hypothetical protein
VNGEVPPDVLDVNVCDWPTSKVTEAGEILTESAALTVTGTVLEDATRLAASLTFT